MKPYLYIGLTLLLSKSLLAQDADWAIINAKIYTSDENQSFAEAMAVEGETIIFVGSNEDVNDHIGDDTFVTDVAGKTILPGLHDVHIHLLEGGSDAASDCFLDAWEFDPWALGQSLADCNPDPNSNGWILAYGHSILTLLDSDVPPKDILDTYFPSTPVTVMEESSHSAWVNSAALEDLEIDGDSEDPQGGHIVMWGGEPSGILLDAAGDISFHAASAPTPEIDGANYNGLVEFGMPALRERGITSIVEGRTYWKRNYIETWQQLKDNDLLTARVVLAPWAYLEDDDQTIIDDLTALYDEGDDMLRVTQVKVYMDGHSLNGTAALDQDYVYNFGWPFTNGLNYFTPERLEDIMTPLENVGYDFFIHAIGNRGSAEALDAIEATQANNPDNEMRHRITHLEITNEEDYPRYAELGVIADMQVTANWSQPNQWSGNAFYIGDDLASVFMPLKSIYDAGGHVVTSSDWDVSSMNPFRSIQNAVTREPENLPDVETAVDARTIHSAYAMRHEDVTGSIEVGKLADFICIDQDIFTIPENQIASTNVELTVLGGQVIYNTGVDVSTIQPEKPAFTIAPTVTQDYVTLYFPTGSHSSGFVVYDAAGREVANVSTSASEGVHRFDCDHLPEGVYLVQWSDRLSELQSRFVVSR